MKEIEGMKKQKKLSEKTQKQLKYEHDQMKGKLDKLWATKEQDVEHCRLVTRYETDKENQAEIERLCDQVSILEQQLRRQEEETIRAHQQIEQMQSLAQIKTLPFTAGQTAGSFQPASTVSLEGFAEAHATQQNDQFVVRRSSRETSVHGSIVASEGTASNMQAHRDEPFVDDRATLTKESVKAAEERRWECEYHLLQNENSRLRQDLNRM